MNHRLPPLPSSSKLKLSVSEAKAATKSVLRAGKYRVKETSRDLWSKTKKTSQGTKKKSKELVGLSSDLLSSLTQRLKSSSQSVSSFNLKKNKSEYFFRPFKEYTFVK